MWMGLFPSVEGLTRTKDWLPLSKKEFCQQKDSGLCISQGSQEDQNKCDMKLYEEIYYGDWLMWLWRLTSPWYVIAPGKLMVQNPVQNSWEQAQVQCLQAREDAGSSWRRARESTFLCLFILFVPQWMGCYWSTLVGHFCLLTWLIQTLSLPEM